MGMGKLNDLIIFYAAAMIGLCSIGIGRIWISVHTGDLDQLLAMILMCFGFVEIIMLVLTEINMYFVGRRRLRG